MRSAERLVGLVETERRQVDGEEIGALRPQHRKADALQPLGQTVAAARQLLAHVEEIVVRLAEPIGDRGLKIGRGGEGEKLVHLGRDPQQRRRGADKADLPAGQRKDLAGRADLDGAIAHPRNGDQRNMLAAVEDHVLPDLVADRDRVELLAEPRQQFEVLARIDHRGRIERIVEQHRLGLVVEDALRSVSSVSRQCGGSRRTQPRNAAGLADDRQIGIVDRLEHDHLVAGLDHGQNGRRQRLGAARRHHHLGHRIEATARASARNAPRSPGAAPECPSSTDTDCSRPSTASAAARRMSSGPGSSGKPWPRLIALLSRASCDIASKIVTGRSAKTLFMDVMAASAAGPGRQSRGLPAQHAAGQMLVVGKAAGLRRQRRRHRALARAAGKHHLLALRDRECPADRSSKAARRRAPG